MTDELKMKSRQDIIEAAFETIPEIKINIQKINTPTCDCMIDSICQEFSDCELQAIEKFLLVMVSACGARMTLTGITAEKVLEQTFYISLADHVLQEQKRRNEIWSEEIED